MIRQFDVFPNPSIRTRAVAPYVVVLQSHHAGDLPTIVVAPLYLPESALPLSELSAEVEIQGQALLAFIPELVGVSTMLLRQRIASLAAHEDAIRRALDRLFTGF
ncbi:MULTISPECIES: CcdB family protein [unclassified Caulobacter]|uniref:CcdB family protein n=1 Tax=unclassified Caulobacter TaxID=2648921 RepID=UPI001304D944|nr:MULTISPECIES: CcdB family protein [unclassified Caulobacter]